MRADERGVHRVEELSVVPGESAVDMQARGGTRMHMQAEAVETNESALRRSLEAESQLQAEVTLLRERTGQLEKALRDQRRTLVSGVQELLRPLTEYCALSGLQVSAPEVIPQVLAWLRQAEGAADEIARLRAEVKTLQRPVEVRRVAPEMRELQELRGMLAALNQRLSAAEQLIAERLPLGAVSPSSAPDPQSYDTFVMSDRQAAEIERALLDAQTRGQRYGG